MPNPVRQRRSSAPGLAAGHAAGLNGINGYLVCPSSNTLLGNNPSMSVACWVYLNVLPNAYRKLVTKAGNGLGDEWFLQINPTGGPGSTPCYEFGTFDGSFHVVDSTVEVSVGVWQFVYGALDFSGHNMFCSTNNANQGTLSTPGGITNGANQVNLGTDNAYASFLNGRVDAVGMWQRILLSAEVTALYNGGSGIRYSGALGTTLVNNLGAWWDLDGPSGGVWRDKSGNGNNLMAHGGVAVVAGKT